MVFSDRFPVLAESRSARFALCRSFGRFARAHCALTAGGIGKKWSILA